MTYNIGMIVSGKVTGIQPYGAFVSLDERTQGLVHVSEVQAGFTQNIHQMLSVGQTVEVQVVDVDEYSQKISLSLRTLEEKNKNYGYRRKKYFTNKNKKIGFSSLEKMLPKWTDEAIDILISK